MCEQLENLSLSKAFMDRICSGICINPWNQSSWVQDCRRFVAGLSRKASAGFLSYCVARMMAAYWLRFTINYKAFSGSSYCFVVDLSSHSWVLWQFEQLYNMDFWTTFTFGAFLGSPLRICCLVRLLLFLASLIAFTFYVRKAPTSITVWIASKSRFTHRKDVCNVLCLLFRRPT